MSTQRREIAAIIALAIAAALVYYYPLLASGNALGIQDWDSNFAWTEFSRVSLVDFHQFPLWNPFKCGGSPHFANPQIPVISMQTLLAILFGTVKGIRLSILFHGVIGFVGFYYLARQHELSRAGSLLAAALFSFSGITGSVLATGMVVFTSFAYTPFVLLCFNKSLAEHKWGIIAGIPFALSLYFAHQVALMLGVYLIVYAIATSAVRRTLAPFISLIMVVLAAGLITLPKLLLGFELTSIFPYVVDDVYGYSIQNLLYFLSSQQQNLFGDMAAQGYHFAIDENSIYVGVLSLGLFLAFFVRNMKGISRNLALIFTLLVITWIAMGSQVQPSLHEALRKLPVYSSFRIAERYRFDLIIPLALLAGLGLDNTVRLLRNNRLATVLSIACLLAIYANLTVFSSTNFLSKTLIIVNPEAQLQRGDAFLQTKTSTAGFDVQRTIDLPEEYLDGDVFEPWSYEYLRIRQNQGVIWCNEPIPPRRSAVGIEDPTYQGEFYLVNSSPGAKVDNAVWSPHQLVFTITGNSSDASSTLVVNQNYYPGWIVQSDSDRCLGAADYKGLLAARINGPAERITLEYRPFASMLCQAGRAFARALP